MQKDIIQKIDLLVEMSETNNHYDALVEEIRIVDMDIAKTKDSIADLTKSMIDTKYMKSSDRLIDENIKISLENKLSASAGQMKEILRKIEEVSSEEEEFHKAIIELETEIATSKKFLDSLELKLKTIGSKDKSVYSFYEDLIDTTTKEMKANEKKLQSKKKAMESVQKRMESFAESRVALEEKIEKDSLQLEETKATLSNPKSYVDEKSRERDEENLKKLNESLENLEQRRLEIATDPAYIGREAKDLLISDDRTSALSKIKELVSKVEEKPYMDYQYEELDEALEQAIQKRDEYANVLETKKYDGTDTLVLDNRVAFLKSRQESKQKEKESLEDQIRDMDTTLVRNLMNSIAETKKVRDTLKDDIEKYKKVMEENNEYKTPKKKASLNAAFHRKCDELDLVNGIIVAYEQDLENIVTTSKILEEQNLTKIQTELTEIEKEIHTIEKNKLLNDLPKDILAVEKDKSELKKLSDDVEAIKERKKYQKMPKQIFDEIELSLGSLDYEKIPEEESTPINNYRIEEIETPEEVKEEEIIEVQPAEEEKVEEIIEEEVPVEVVPVIEPEIPEPKDVEPIEDLENITQEEEEIAPVIEETENEKEYPPRKTVIEEEQASKVERLKVISVEPFDEDETEEKANETKEEDYMVNDFQDTNYISFNDLLEGEKNNEN